MMFCMLIIMFELGSVVGMFEDEGLVLGLEGVFGLGGC